MFAERHPVIGWPVTSRGRRRPMRIRSRHLAWLPILLTLSCAAPSELVRRSGVSLAAGDAARAFDWARRALDKEPANPAARAAATDAATVLVGDAKSRIRNLAEVDTVSAARQSLELEDFRAQLVHYRIELPPDPGFVRDEALIRSGAAGWYYDAGAKSMSGHRPKRAYSEFVEAGRFASGYRDVGERERGAWEQALTRVAVLPFNNEVSIPGLSHDLAEETYQKLAYQLTSPRFKFTRLIGSDQINRKLTVSQMGHLSREEAVRLGRALGAQRVVLGRFHGLRSNTDTDSYHETIFRKVTERDESGGTRVRFVEQRFDAVMRQRQIWVAYDLQVIDTDEETALAHRGEQKSLVARTVFTRFEPVGSCDDYCLVSPDLKAAEPERAKRVEQEWSGRFGSWTLPRLLERARKDSGRTRYLPQYHSEFASAGTSTPIFLDDLPPADELATIALFDVWVPVLEVLRELDGVDAVDVRAVADED